MRKPDREISVFSLSALDVLAMATGAFVVLMTLLMPYYRKTQDAQAEIEDIRVATAEQMSRAAEFEAEAASATAAAARLSAEARAAAARADKLAQRLAAVENAIETAEARGGRAIQEPDETEVKGDIRVVEELDVVFVMDTTRSMLPALADLAQSLEGIARVLERLVPSVRIGFVAYTDSDTGYPPIRALQITETSVGLNRILAFVENLRPPPRGSRTIEEDVHLGVQRALAMNWRPLAKQVVVVIGDAQAHRRFRSRAINRVEGFVRGGENRSVSALFVSTPTSRSRGDFDRAFFVELAEAGRGTFNDHSGQMFESVILSVLTPGSR
jgi:hypothetical protein